MRRSGRRDGNHAAVRDGLARIPGCTVEDTASFGGGFPDLVVAFRGRLYLIEIKDGRKPPSERGLTPAEAKFAARFGPHYHVVLSLDEALAVLGLRKVAA